MANMIARLGVVLGLDSAEFSRGLDSAGKKLEQFSQAAEKYGKIAAVGMVAAGIAAVRYADELFDVAEANEVAIGTVLKLSNALQDSGGKADNAGKMLSAFAKFIDEAAGGSEKAQKTAKELGISLQDLGKLSQEELLNKLVANLAKVEDPITRNAKAMEIFSKAAKGVDMVGFADKIAQANPLIEEQEKAIKAAADVMEFFEKTSRDVMLVLATELGPILKSTVDYMKTMSDYGVSLSGIFKTVFQTVAVLGSEVGYFFKAIFDEIGHTYNNAVILVTKGVDAAIEANKKYNNSVLAQRIQLDLYQAQVMGVPQYGNAIDALALSGGSKSKASSGGGRKVTDADEKERQKKAEEAKKEAKRLEEAAEKARLRALEKYFNELQRLDKILLDIANKENSAFTDSLRRIENEEAALKSKNGLFQLEQQIKDMRSEEIQLNRELYMLDQQRLQNIREINRNNDLEAEAKHYLIQLQNELTESSNKYVEAQYNAALAQRKGTFEEGFTKSMKAFLRDLPTELEIGAKTFESVMGNMESAIDRFVKTGKIGFKDLAKSIIQDMIAIQMKAAASNFLSSMFGSMFGTRANPYQPAAMAGVPGYADGGSPSVGQASIVGERGPELFVPRTAGSIIPNHALAGMGGTTMVTNNYINAIDTKSFEERLYGSSNAIWAANQYANKSLAVNRGRA
jgi:lambda family phage tail tape measure protein